VRIEIVHIGDELLRGNIDPYPKEMIEMIRGRGGSVAAIHVVRDDRADIMRALEAACDAGTDILVLTGGLGPTLDDITREVVADFLGTELRVDSDSVRWLEAAVQRMYGSELALNEQTLRMAQVPLGAKALRNITGAAAGIEVVRGRTRIFCLPGFPREMLPMFREYVLPLIESDQVFEREIRAWRGESTMEPLFEQVVRDYRVRIASIPKDNWREEGNLIIVRGEDEDEVERATEHLRQLIEASRDEFIRG